MRDGNFVSNAFDCSFQNIVTSNSVFEIMRRKIIKDFWGIRFYNRLCKTLKCLVKIINVCRKLQLTRGLTFYNKLFVVKLKRFSI